MNRLFLILVLFVHSAFAFEMNGTMIDNRDGTFEVTLNSEKGDVFNGSAVLGADGNLVVSVVDESGEFYIGLALEKKEGLYDLKLRSNSSGDLAFGTLELD